MAASRSCINASRSGVVNTISVVNKKLGLPLASENTDGDRI
jgi:hypothetical protein